MPTTNGATTRPTARQLAEGLGALAVLASGLVGIPAVLAATVGWPLPHHLPTGGQVTGALATPIPDSFWPHLFATLGWLAWAYLAFSIAVNLVAHLRGRGANRRPRLGRQSTVAALITAIVVLGQLRVPTARVVVVAPVVQLVADTAAPVNAQPATVTHPVVDGDTLWGIAATYYGGGEEWQAIYGANVGVPQPGGTTLTDAHWIYPGWTLVIPDVARAVTAAPAAPAAHSDTRVPVVHALAGGNHHTAVQPESDVRASGSPRAHTQLNPGQRLDHMNTPAKVPAVLGSPAAHHRSAPSLGPDVTDKASGTPHVTSGGHGDDVTALAIGTGIFGLAAIGLVSALDRRRRRQTMRRTPGRRIPLPVPHTPLADLELQLRHYARADSLFWLTRLGDLLTHAADRAGRLRPEVLGVHVRPHGLDVFVTEEAGDPPAPFEAQSGEPAVWHLPATTDPGVLDDTVVAEPVPLTLFGVGRGTDGTLLVNLDHYRSVHINVDAAEVVGTLAAIGTELSAPTGAQASTVLAVGFGHGVIDRLEGGVVTDDLDCALAHPSRKGNDIVLADGALITGQHADLVDGTATLRLVTAGPISPAGIRLVIDPTDPVLEPHHFHPVELSHVADETLDQVEALLELAESGAEKRPDAEPRKPVNMSATPLDLAPISQVTLGLFGDPTVAVGDGEARDLVGAVYPTAETKARRVVELLVYLAAHDGTATRGQWLTDVSPDKVLSDGYIRNLVLLTRRSLEAVTGLPDLLAYDRNTQRLTLAENVRTDWTIFRSLAASGEPETLHKALSLVRGIPFGSNPEPWTSASGISYVVIEEITDAAATLGEHALSTGYPQLATWAARQGQLANRYDMGLWRILLRAARDTSELQNIWQELHALLAIDGDPAADLDPTTVDLFHALNTTRPPIGEVVVLQDEDDAVIPTRQAV